ncbi:hypothetical protein C8F04DRAFT_87546 [Mycena alexandri]|uniref:Uncharacterized protein n=1 Tax=Mycena alexandri TaxID=1745969 RepID=A0AAD6SGP0_9AGAR|nr:hypothetical protein C8F04DRAFT_87546 [Mycena alexandri]
MNPYFTPDSHDNLIRSLFRSTVAEDLIRKADIVAAQPQTPIFPNEMYQTLDVQVGMHIYSIQYRIQYTAANAQKPPVWRTYGKPSVEGVLETFLGYVEIDSLIYRDPGPLVDRLPSGHLMLKLMARAVRDSSAIRVAFEVQPVKEAGTEVVLGYLELMVARAEPPPTNGNGIVEEYRRQPARKCSYPGCWLFLPVAGPTYCMYHSLASN